MPDVPELGAALKVIKDRAKRYHTLARYYDGDHPLAFATEKYENAFGSLFRAFALNLCPAVVDAVADRLVVENIESETESTEQAEAALATWKALRMDRRAGEIHQEALCSGDSYAIVWPGQDGEPRIHPQKAGQVTVHYSDEDPDIIDWAAKAWILEDGRARMTIYFPDRIEKYITTSSMGDRRLPNGASAFTVFMAPGEPWPLRNPYGRVPVFHWANNAGTAEFGRSELHDVIPIQNALNKAVTDMLVAMEFHSLPQRFATGLEVDIDPATGRAKEPFKAAVDRIWTTADPETTFGQFPQADLTQIIAVKDDFMVDVARVVGTPLHYLMLTEGNFPSGESLKTAEARFTKRVYDRQIAYGNVWEDVLTFCAAIRGEKVEGLSLVWRDPAPRSERDEWEVANLKRTAGVSQRQVLREAGYSEDEVNEMLADAEQAEDQRAERLLRDFDRGAA